MKRIVFDLCLILVLLIALLVEKNLTLLHVSPFKQPSYPHVLLLNPKILYTNKEKINAKDPEALTAYNNLLKSANRILTKTPPSVVTKQQIPPSGDKHDYLSLAPYAWPNPQKPNGLPYIGKDGQVNPERYSISDYQNLKNMISWSHTLALAYYFSGDRKYASKAAQLLRTWFVNPTTRMNPNLTYSQVINGRTLGQAAGIIDTQQLPLTVDTIMLLRPSSTLSKDDLNGLASWFEEYLSWLQTSAFGTTETQSGNNIGTWYDVQVASIALLLGKKTVAKHAIEQVRDVHIAREIMPDGKQPLELTRTKSWDYSMFNIQALCDAAILGEKVHVDLWHYSTKDGRSIAKTLDFLMPYLFNQKKWEYPQITVITPIPLIIPLKQATLGTGNQIYNVVSNKLEQESHKDFSLFL